jgi:hypothetical protein
MILYDKYYSMFFDKTCDIYTTTYSTVWWVPKRTYTKLYSDIPCNFEQNKQVLRWTGYAENTDIPQYIIVIPLTYNLVRENYKVVMTDPFLWTLWDYVISSVNANKSISGWIDCITLYVSNMKWQL